MKGDFSTERFNPAKHYNRVLKQQGRVDLDSDWNEQAAISQYLLRTLIVDLLGRRGGPVENCGFGLADPAREGLKAAVGDFIIGAGRYYVDGLLIENEEATYYSAQPSLPDPGALDTGKTYLAYLDVWERHITYLEDDSIREVALSGPDTTTRVKTVWQVKVIDAAPPQRDQTDKTKEEIAEKEAKLKEAQAAFEKENNRSKKAALKRRITALQKQIAAADTPPLPTPTPAPLPAPQLPGPQAEPLPPGEVPNCDNLLNPLLEWTSGTMTARLEPSEPEDTPCVLAPDSKYRGLENHLYRIEIHNSGDTADAESVPTFKWSRENGSIATRWLATTGNEVRVANTRGFAAGQWVEFTSETEDLLGQPGPMTRIVRVEGDILVVESAPAFDEDMALPKVRRWDQTANDELTLVNGAIAIVPGTGEDAWIEIEDGIEVQFSEGPYRSGDYWLIAARVATGAIDWPADADGKPRALAPLGIVHHYAPLFMVEATGKDPFVELLEDCRCRFAPLPCIEDADTRS